MKISAAIAEHALSRVSAAFSAGDGALQVALDCLSAPVYVTDAEGIVTHFNSACVKFAGRRPRAGHDQWCVTWKLFTTEGEALPHDQCPMALAVKEKQSFRGLRAVAERPDGTRVAFTPFPTPLFSGSKFAGAVNVLIDITDVWQIEALREQAQRCRLLAAGMGDRDVAKNLTVMADEYEAKALELDQARHQQLPKAQ